MDIKEIQEIVNQELSNFSLLTDIVGLNIYPVVAPQNSGIPFIVYDVSELPALSKDMATEFNITVRSYAKTNSRAVDAITAVKKAFAASSYAFVSQTNSESAIDDENYYVEQNIYKLLNIK